MKIPLLPRLHVWLLLVLFPMAVPAQTQPANITANFTILALVDKPITDLLYKSGARLVPFQAPAFTRSTSYPYVGPATMTFYRMEAKDGTSQPVEVNTVTLPAGGGKVLVVIAGSAPGYSMGAVADAPDSLPVGKARLYNATPLPLTILCNQENKVQLKPFESLVVEPKNGDMGVGVSRLDQDGQWEPVASGIYQLPGTTRLNIFLVVSNSPRFIFQTAVQIYPLVEKSTPPEPGPSTSAGGGGSRRSGGSGG